MQEENNFINEMPENTEGKIIEIKEEVSKKGNNGISGKMIALLLVISVAVSALSGAGGAFFTYKFLLPNNTDEENTSLSESTSDTLPLVNEAPVLSDGIKEEDITFMPELPSFDEDTVSQPSSTSPVVDTDSALSKGEIYAEAVNSIVSVTATWNEYYSSIFGTYSQPVTSKGTGFVITENGYIITNNHVVSKGEEIIVTDYDGNEYSAVLVGREPANDVAVLKIDAKMTPVNIGNSSELQVGDDILVIGNALGELSYTFTDGIVSHLSRRVDVENGVSINMFQTNTAINNGNSGGPVYNMDGEVVGIASAKYASDMIEGLGFCIPIDDVKEMVSDIIVYGYVTGKPCLDISLQTVTSSMSSRYSLPVGCYVVALDSDGAAASAGIKTKDVITKLGSETISSCEDVAAALSKYKAGDSVSITYYRNGKSYTTNLVFSERTLKEARTQYSNVFDY